MIDHARALPISPDNKHRLRSGFVRVLARAVCAAATISAFACGGLQRSTEPGVITIHPETSFQTFVGWQASGETGLTDNIASGKLYRDEVLDAAVDLGINRVRIGIMSGLTENSTDHFQNFLDQDLDYDSNPAYPAIGANRRVPVNDNDDPTTINPDGFKWASLDWQIDMVVLPLQERLKRRGEDLWWSITYVHFSTSDQLHVDNPAEYGELILAVWEHINDKYGMVPNGLEIFLEPDNGVAEITEREMAAMIVAARDRLVAAGYPKPVFTAPSTLAGPKALPYYLKLKETDPMAASYIDEIGYHRYKPIDEDQLQQLRLAAEADRKMVAMTEFAGATYVDLHNDLRVGRVSSWEQYALGYPTEDNGYQYFYVTGTSPNFTVNIGSRTKFLRQYMKFIRAGAVMKGVTNSNPAFDGLAFRNADGTYVVPIKCDAGGSITVENLPAGSYGIKYTTNGEYDVDLPTQTIAEGGSVSFWMPEEGVATVYSPRFENTVDGRSPQN